MNINMLDQENQNKTDNPTTDVNNIDHSHEANNNNDVRSASTSNGTSSTNPLSEHDYCSPNKNSSHVSKMPLPNGPAISTSEEGNCAQAGVETNQILSSASSSSSPTKMADPQQSDTFSHLDNELHMSDSSSSSSVSSDESTNNLVIAQDDVGRSLAPKDTPSVARAKLGRRPLLKTEFDIGKKLQKNEPKQQAARTRKPRLNTSVTDKSQWITGEAQIDSVLSEQLPETREKRQRKEVNDPEFSHFTSSDYSSSDAESDQESEEWDEEDPDRPWCNCNKPDDGTFMISCDVCKYWFHGHCVGVTESLNKRWQKENKEYRCTDCEEAIQSGIPKEKIPPRLAKKPKKTFTKRRGRPRKSAIQTREPSTRLSLRSSKKPNDTNTLNTRASGRRSSTKSAGSESFNEFEHPDRLKELIRERKKAFFLKHRLSEQLKAEKMKELGVSRRSVTASLGESLESLASTTNSPNMNNLPINIKSEHKEKSKPNIVLQINKKESGSESGGQRLVTTIVKKRKHSEANDTSTNELFTADALQVSKKIKKAEGRASPTTPNAKNSGKVSPGLNDSKASDGHTSRSLQKLVASELAASKRKRKDSEPNPSTGAQNSLGPQQMIKKIQETLEIRRDKMKINMPSEKIEKLAVDIQGQLADCYKEGSPKYINKFRSLIFNLRDVKNEVLLTNVLNGEILPSKLVRMSHDDMASNELSRWRERENKHTLELIKRDAELAAEEVIVKKTHKGEEVISAAHSESDNPASSAATHQDLPTTPTKCPTKLESSKSPQLGSRADAIKSTSLDEPKDTQSLAHFRESANISDLSSLSDPLALLDTTKDHKTHVYDMGCKICTNAQASGVESATEPVTGEGTVEKEHEEQKAQDQPKRLRVSIDTKLDPSNLSRLREPLIKPTDQTHDSAEIVPTMNSPNADPLNSRVDSSPNADQECEGEDDQELYDPETSTMPASDKADFELPIAPDSACWSGTIQMQDVGKFDASAKPISGNANFVRNKLSQTLFACGRIAPDQVTAYIKKLKSTTKNQILLLQFHPLTEDDKSKFDAFFDYLYTRNRCAVINSTANSQILKDFYILPIHGKSHIPDILKPINGPGLDRTVPNCLMGLLVKQKRSKPESGNATTYTPAIINQ